MGSLIYYDLTSYCLGILGQCPCIVEYGRYCPQFCSVSEEHCKKLNDKCLSIKFI